jgi:hypothetical protein
MHVIRTCKPTLPRRDWKKHASKSPSRSKKYHHRILNTSSSPHRTATSSGRIGKLEANLIVTVLDYSVIFALPCRCTITSANITNITICLPTPTCLRRASHSFGDPLCPLHHASSSSCFVLCCLLALFTYRASLVPFQFCYQALVGSRYR